MSATDDLVARLSAKITDFVSKEVNDEVGSLGSDDLMTLLEDVNEGIKSVFDGALELIKEREEEESEEEDEDAEED